MLNQIELAFLSNPIFAKPLSGSSRPSAEWLTQLIISSAFPLWCSSFFRMDSTMELPRVSSNSVGCSNLNC